QMYQWHVTRTSRRQAWYVWHSDVVDFELGPEAVPDLAPRPMGLPPQHQAEQIAYERGLDAEVGRSALGWGPDLCLRRGTPEPFPAERSSYDNALIKVEPMSMERISEPLLHKRKQDWLALVARVVPLIRQYPEVDWVKLLDEAGQSMNQKDAGSVINIDLARQLAGVGHLFPGGAPAPGSSPGSAASVPAGGMGAGPIVPANGAGAGENLSGIGPSPGARMLGGLVGLATGVQ